MKRLHMHIGVNDLQKNIAFYAALFKSQPDIVKNDYAKWMLDDPMVNFAISTRSAGVGLDHVGIQTETEQELSQLSQQLEDAGIAGVAQQDAGCCYAQSDKYWVQDPQGIAWETFHSLGTIPVFSHNQPQADNNSCCVPDMSCKV